MALSALSVETMLVVPADGSAPREEPMLNLSCKLSMDSRLRGNDGISANT
jgi:hypothetical protein